MRRLGGYLLTATALIACPCHLFLLLPLALGLLGGTALEATLAAHRPSRRRSDGLLRGSLERRALPPQPADGKRGELPGTLVRMEVENTRDL